MSLQPRVALGDNFLAAFAAIPKRQQRAVSNFVAKFRANPTSPGINYETIHHAQDKNFRSVRIDQDYRGIISKPEKGNVYILLWVDKHDDAYAWARRHRCAVHPDTGVLQLFEIEHDVETIPAPVQPQEPVTSAAVDMNLQSASDAVPAAQDAPRSDESPVSASQEFRATVVESGRVASARATAKPLFHALDDQQLSQLGVPAERIVLVRSLHTEDQLEQAEPKLPIEAFEALYLLAAGVPLAQIMEEYGPKIDKPVDIDDFEAALDQAATQRRFFVPEDEQELARMLNAPLERWRVFLHPSQRDLVERIWNGPVRVLGGAGTGKTVVAMHRARWLVSQADWPKSARLLFTTFSSNLAVDIRQNLEKICTPEQMQRIEVVNLDMWVSQFVRRNGYQSRIVYPGGNDRIYDRCWEAALALKPTDQTYSDSFYHEEWQRVILAQNIHSQREYLFADRKGRGVALTRRIRADVWAVFEEMREQLARKDCVTAQDATFYALDILKSGQDSRQYHAVVVDETQDLGSVALTLLRHLVSEKPNDLFLVGDAHQRIYQQQAPLSHSGINIMGRGRKLKINYRTTERIRSYAMRVLDGVEVDDLDEGLDSGADYKSLVVGQVPSTYHAPDRNSEIEWVIQNIKTLEQQGVPLNEIAVVARTNRLCGDYEQALNQHGIATHTLSRQRADDPTVPGVRIATMHRVKGLEFRCVMVVAVKEGTVPLTAAMRQTDDPVEQRLHEMNERALFHVSCTRAARYLFVSGYGVKSPFWF